MSEAQLILAFVCSEP